MSDDEPRPPAEDEGIIPNRPSVSDDHRFGARLGSGIARVAVLPFLNILLFIARLVPGSTRFWRGWIKAGYKGLAKTKSGATHVAHIERGGELVHEPATYKREDDGPLDNPRWVTAGGRWFEAPNKASDISHVGKTPTVWASSTANDLGSWIQAEVAEVLDLGEGVSIMTDAELTLLTVDDPTAGANPEQAVADGGMHRTMEISVDNPGVLKDRLVPLDTYDDRFSGRVVSMDKYYETYPSTADQEKMEEQRLMGKLEEKDPKADRAFLIKVMLIAGAIALGGIGMVTVVPQLLGGGGGGALLGLLPFVASRGWRS